MRTRRMRIPRLRRKESWNFPGTRRMSKRSGERRSIFRISPLCCLRRRGPLFRSQDLEPSTPTRFKVTSIVSFFGDDFVSLLQLCVYPFADTLRPPVRRRIGGKAHRFGRPCWSNATVRTSSRAADEALLGYCSHTSCILQQVFHKIDPVER